LAWLYTIRLNIANIFKPGNSVSKFSNCTVLKIVLKSCVHKWQCGQIVKIVKYLQESIFGLRPQTQPIYSFYFGVPWWPLFLWCIQICLYYNYSLYCKCWEPPILTFGMLTSDRVFPGLPVTPVLYRTENCNNKSISCNPIRV